MHLYPSHWKWRWWNHILCREPGTKSFQVWNDKTKQKFKQALQAPDIQSLLDDFTNCNHADANTATLKFTDILQLAIHKVFPKRVRSAYKTSVKRKTRYSQECQLAKRAFKKAQRQFKVDKGNLNRRQIFVREKRKYKKFLYAFIKYSKLKSIYDINDLEKKDSKTFWKELKRIISPTEDHTEYINPGEWVHHFQNVLQLRPLQTSDDQFLKYVQTSLPLIERISEHSDKLNADITDQELFSGVKGLKSGKSVYIDEISNEALKSEYGELQGPLVHLFNIIFRSGEYANIWRDGFIVPIHKKNGIMNANNCRGIIISSCVAKLFLRIVTRRIEEFMKTSGRWSVNQLGFRSDHRTEDSLFIINTMFDSYVIHQNKPLYAAFVDFSKFFDKINRTHLLYKLLKCGITGRIYDIVKSMY